MSLPDFLDPQEHRWMKAPAIAALFAAVEAGGGEMRIVGGAVRDSLLGRPVGDIDMAVNLPPERVIALLAAQGIKTVPTGIAHGTVTAVYDHKGYEITTLRHDKEPDGRHSKVEYTDDWCADAARRDFTMNALYLDKSHHILDSFDGRGDLERRLIRFIGDPHERIREDVLRILRAFRFLAQLPEMELAPASVQACYDLAPSLVNLSAERVWKELSRLLSASDPVPSCNLMAQGGVLSSVLPEATRFDRLAALCKVEGGRFPFCPVRRLAALLGEEAGRAGDRLRLSNAEKRKLTQLCAFVQKEEPPQTIRQLGQSLYDYGAEVTRDGLLLVQASGAGCVPDEMFAAIAQWSRPVFPLGGRDIKQLGVKDGPAFGVILAAVERWWREQDFQPDHAACLAKARAETGR